MGKAIGVVFTAIVAPIVVIVATQYINKQGKQDDKGKKEDKQQKTEPAGRAAPSAGPVATVAAVQPANANVIVADGVGSSYETATQNAFRNAVRTAVAALVGTETFARFKALITAKVLPQSEAYIAHYDVKVSNQAKPKGPDAYHRQITATVNQRDLTAALKALHIPVR
jgi:hypothetical protein